MASRGRAEGVAEGLRKLARDFERVAVPEYRT